MYTEVVNKKKVVLAKETVEIPLIDNQALQYKVTECRWAVAPESRSLVAIERVSLTSIRKTAPGCSYKYSGAIRVEGHYVDEETMLVDEDRVHDSYSLVSFNDLEELTMTVVGSWDWTKVEVQKRWSFEKD